MAAENLNEESDSTTSTFDGSIENENHEKTLAAINFRGASPSWSDQASLSRINSWKARVSQFELPNHFATRTVAKPRPWKTTWIRFGPLSGICCILLAVTSIIASFGVLAGSDGQPVDGWSVAPPTYLAVFTAIASE